MKQREIRKLLPAVFMLVAICAIAAPAGAELAPEFTVRTLNGGTLSRSSLRGRITLMQFWTTWCPHCRSDQAAVDDVERMFSGQGLQVIAINVGESEPKVKDYLRKHPRACQIALSESKDLPKSFGARGYPYYLLIDQDGRIVDRQSGAGGKESLLYLLRQAGLTERRNTKLSGSQSQPASGQSSGAQILEVPGAATPRGSGQMAGAGVAGKPAPKTVFILADGERFESDHYTLDSQSLHITVGTKRRTIPLTELDRAATLSANRERGVELHFPSGSNQVFIGF